MIGSLRGRILLRRPPRLVIEVGGVGYELEAPLSTFTDLPASGEATVFTHLQVREDALNLYAFASERERQLFRALIRTSGVGAKLALAILSGLSVEEFTQAVNTRDVSTLKRLPGIGQKTLEKLRPWITVKVDLNQADLHDLESIGLDTASAERLLAWRHKHGRFNRVADLTRVPGFGEGALVTLRPLVWVGTP